MEWSKIYVGRRPLLEEAMRDEMIAMSTEELKRSYGLRMCWKSGIALFSKCLDSDSLYCQCPI